MTKEEKRKMEDIREIKEACYWNKRTGRVFCEKASEIYKKERLKNGYYHLEPNERK